LLLDAIVLVYLNRQASSYIFRSRQYFRVSRADGSSPRSTESLLSSR
jgi:hypothetical protein